MPLLSRGRYRRLNRSCPGFVFPAICERTGFWGSPSVYRATSLSEDHARFIVADCLLFTASGFEKWLFIFPGKSVHVCRQRLVRRCGDLRSESSEYGALPPGPNIHQFHQPSPGSGSPSYTGMPQSVHSPVAPRSLAFAQPALRICTPN